MDARRQALIAIAVIAVSVGATALLWWMQPPPPPPPAALNEPVFDFSPDVVESIDVESWQGALRAARRERGWEVTRLSRRRHGDDAPAETEPKPSPGDVNRVMSELVGEIVKMPLIDRFPREDRPLSDFGLDKPQAVISLGLESGETKKLEIGSLTVTSTALYARSAPPDDVMQVGSLIFSAIDAALYHLRGLDQGVSPAPPAQPARPAGAAGAAARVG